MSLAGPKEIKDKKKHERMIESLEALVTHSFSAEDLTILRSVLDSSASVNIRKIDLITLDLNMPKLSGMETLREIRKIDGQVPVIIITGYGTQKDEKEALHYGVTDFISKPFNTSKMISLINRILGERI